MEKLFELAVRSKYRFPFKGSISLEDLWDLRIQDLDTVYKALKSQLKVSQEDSLLNVKTVANKDLENKLAIVEYIFTTKNDEQKAVLDKRKKAEERKRLIELIARKKDEALEAKDVTELEAELKKLMEEEA